MLATETKHSAEQLCDSREPAAIHSRLNNLVVWNLQERYSLRYHDAEEIAQDAWAVFFAKQEPVDSPLGLLVTISGRMAWRKRKSLGEKFIGEHDIAAKPAREPVSESVRDAINQLDGIDAKISEAVLLGDSTIIETAATLGVSPSTVSKRLRKIKIKLRFLLRDFRRDSEPCSAKPASRRLSRPDNRTTPPAWLN